jgi:hypothetical protein
MGRWIKRRRSMACSACLHSDEGNSATANEHHSDVEESLCINETSQPKYLPHHSFQHGTPA